MGKVDLGHSSQKNKMVKVKVKVGAKIVSREIICSSKYYLRRKGPRVQKRLREGRPEGRRGRCILPPAGSPHTTPWPSSTEEESFRRSHRDRLVHSRFPPHSSLRAPSAALPGNNFSPARNPFSYSAQQSIPSFSPSAPFICGSGSEKGLEGGNK